eukprot:NODE_9380_length_343_cov_154.677083.p4 GENE.NODE_9380_length_343_cov_154.677083~~NODE_9380_length_343_cov_154.677083.p4  ORF type:complete len:91 (+),score=9.61 NODE_9380_length_343_cov_154.677083:3-275(+)
MGAQESIDCGSSGASGRCGRALAAMQALCSAARHGAAVVSGAAGGGSTGANHAGAGADGQGTATACVRAPAAIAGEGCRRGPPTNWPQPP